MRQWAGIHGRPGSPSVLQTVASMDEPQTWHYGLMARWWAEFNTAEPEELAYYRAAIERFGQPALDLGCGAGRLMLPLLADGLDVDGVDISSDMLAQAAELGARQGMKPRLYPQTFHELDLERRYRTIYICDSFGLGGYRQQDRQALRRIFEQLEPGGGLVFSYDLPYGEIDPNEWARWLPAHRGAHPGGWPKGNRRQIADGDELELSVRASDFDALLQRRTLEMRLRLWRAGRVVAEEERQLHENLYFAQEILLMLEDAGFGDVAMEGRYTGIPATPDDGTLVFVAQHPV